MSVRVSVEASFVREAKKLPPDRRKAAEQTLVKFMAQPDLPRLKFRRLEGAASYFIINARRGDRIILRKIAADSYAAVDVGPHDNVYRRWNR